MTSISTPDLSDAAPEARAIELALVNYGKVRAFGGPAVTIKCHEDNSLVKQCVEEPGEGRVIVVDGGGSLRRSLLGDMLAESAVANGWAGLVINGAIRDVDEIAGMARKRPYALARSPRSKPNRPSRKRRRNSQPSKPVCRPRFDATSSCCNSPST